MNAGRSPSPTITSKSEASPQTLKCGYSDTFSPPKQDLCTRKPIKGQDDNLALRAFTENLALLYGAVTPHIDWVIKKCITKHVLRQESCDQLAGLLSSPVLEPSQKAIILLVLTQLAITADYHCLRCFIRVLKKYPPLKSTSDMLKKSYSKLTVIFLSTELLFNFNG